MTATDYDVCVAVNYYAPYVSGLTEVARVVAEGLVSRGLRVAVVACRHETGLPARETIAGVDVYRTPVVATIGRGLVSPSFATTVRAVARRSRLLHLHLPMLEAGLITSLVRSTPVVSTHHIDLWLPPGRVNRIATRAVEHSVRAALRRSSAAVVNSGDQARASDMWPTLQSMPWVSIPPPCIDRGEGRASYRTSPGLHIGFLGRIVPDKGIQYLVKAFAGISDPGARLLIGGDHAGVAGGSVIEMVAAAAAADPRIRILGLLRGQELADFYASIDVFALPSVAESFGIVQAEAMMRSIPCVTTDLPGGRYPVQATGFGKIVPPAQPEPLREAILSLAGLDPARRAAGAASATEQFSVQSCLHRYATLFEAVLARSPGRPLPAGEWQPPSHQITLN
ncbi:glycosyltransferase [Kineosporia mesophila]|uniref:Glycosyltransferase n=1 Tax=Kineosporia mesophila TaxID=566012 RepID=A0ABP6ZVQ5_9ACTN|nr:glycosyltransferase family 4 protein [Kineosporia mesophila]